jgi:hypothetical protein
MSISAFEFVNAVEKIDTSIRELIDLIKEHDTPEVSAGVRRYYPEYGKLPFQETQQFERPDEFLQSLMDIFKVQFEPQPPGTFFLNSNLKAYLSDTISKGYVRFSYASITSVTRVGFKKFWHTTVEPHLDVIGMSIGNGQSFVAITVDPLRYSLDLVTEVNDTLETGITLASVVRAMAGDDSLEQPIVCGYTKEDGINDNTRVSIWNII